MRRSRGQSLDPGNDGELSDALVAVGTEEGAIVLERHAAVGIAVWPEHIAVREQAAAAVDGVLAADRVETQGGNRVEQSLAGRKIVNVRRSHAVHSDRCRFRIVEL